MVKRISQSLLVFLSYALLTIIMTWPLAGRLGTHIPGSEGDAWVHQWTFHYVLETLRNGGALFHTDLMYYPEGVSLLYHNFAWLHIGLWLPLQEYVGGAAAYTLIFMGGFAFTGLATYWLAKEVLADESAAYVAGLITAFWPYTLSHHNHPNLIFIGFVPLVMLWSKRVIEGDRWWQVGVLGMMIALLGITRWQLLVIAGLLIGLYLVWQLWEGRERFGRSVVRLTAAGLIGLLLMLPLLWPVLVNQVVADAEALAAGEQRSGQTDLLAYLTPSRYHPLWGAAAFTLTENFTVDRVFTPFLGFTTLFLAVYGIVKRWRAAWFWLLAAVVYIILALGGLLQINGEFYFPLPYLVLEETVLGEIIRRPSRFNVILSIPMALLAGYGVMALRERLAVSGVRVQVSGGVAVVAGVLILGEYVVEYPTYALDTPRWYEELAEKEAEFGVLDLPMHRRIYDEQYMFYQFTHGKPLVGGHVSRPPAETFATINGIRFLRDYQMDNRPVEEITAVGAELRQLSESNVPYLILHKQFMNDETIEQWKRWLVIDPVYEDGQLVVFRTNPLPERDYLWQDVFMEDVGVIENQVSPRETAQDGWVTVDVVWASNTILPQTVIENVRVGQDVQVCLYLLDQSTRRQETTCKMPAVPFEEWRAGEILRDQFMIHMNPYLQAGTYMVSADIRYVDTGEQIGQAVGLGEVVFSAVSRSFERPEPTNETNLVWGQGEIGLTGYDLVQSETQLDLTLHWSANERPEQSNVVFVHLVDAKTNNLVKQHDATPRNWSYPTNWWEAGEYVTDTIILSLDDVPVGRYQLMVGMYDVETQERVAVWQDEVLVEDGRVLLEIVTKQ